MSVTGITSTLFNLPAQSISNRFKQFQEDFQQLGQDLQTGNLNAAQSDVANLQKLRSSSTDTSSNSASNTSVAQTLQQLGSDLKSGDLKDAQQLYSDLVQKLQTRRPHHEHHISGPQTVQDLNQLQQALQGGNLSSAQTAYNTLAQDFQQFSLNGVSSAATSATDSLSLQA
jgi:soluble cytochrome b562